MATAADGADAAAAATGTPDPVRVLLVDVSDRGGIARYTQALRGALEEEGVRVRLAAPHGLADPGLALARHVWGSEFSRLGRFRRYGRRLLELAPSAALLARAVVRARGEVIHVQTEVVPALDPLVLRAVARRVPVVVTAHDPEPLQGGARASARQARRWRAADAVIVHAEAARHVVEALAPGVPVSVVPVDLPLGGKAPSRDEARRRLGLDGAPTALLLGLIRPHKGVDLLADSWPSVRAAVPGARLFVVGEPYPCPDLDRLERAGGVEVRRGFVTDEEFDCWAAAADLLVLPYRYGSHSGVLHRGLAVGTPVLASPPLTEEVERTGAGEVVALEVGAWAGALVAALTGHGPPPPPPPPPPPSGRRSATTTLAVYRDVLGRRAAGAPVAATGRTVPDRRAGVRSAGPAEQRRLRVLTVSNARQPWGAEFAVLALTAPLAARGVDLVLGSPPGGELVEQWTALGLRHVALDVSGRRGIRSAADRRAPVGQLVTELVASGRSVWSIARAAREVDIIHSSSLWTHLDCAVAGRMLHRPVVLDLHDIVRPGLGRRVLTTAAWLSSATVAVSSAVADCVGRRAAPRVRVMAPAVDLHRFRPGPCDPVERARLTSSVEDPLVGIVGRIDPEKGVDLVVRAVSALTGPLARTHLAVVGSPGFDSGAYPERLQADAARSLGDRVRFPGRSDDVPTTLKAIDVLVNASVAEPFGLGVLEGQATGTPVVATRSGGVADLLVDGDNALLVPVGDAAALTSALERVLTDDGLRARLSRRGREVAEAHGVDAFADVLAALYRDLAGRASGARRGG